MAAILFRVRPLGEKSPIHNFRSYLSVLKNSLGTRFRPGSATKHTGFGASRISDSWSPSAQRRLFQHADLFSEVAIHDPSR